MLKILNIPKKGIIMYPRVNYEMTKEDLEAILEACKPVPLIMLQCEAHVSPQENANRAWAALGKKMGFDPMTVQPESEGRRFFSAVPSAVPSETEEQYVDEEIKAAKIARINQLAIEILARQEELNSLEKEK